LRREPMAMLPLDTSAVTPASAPGAAPISGRGPLKPDYLSDKRIASVALPDLRDFLGSKGVEPALVQAASTKFSLVSLAEEKNCDLEELLSTVDQQIVNSRQVKQKQRENAGVAIKEYDVSVATESGISKVVVKGGKRRNSAAAAAAAAATMVQGAKEMLNSVAAPADAKRKAKGAKPKVRAKALAPAAATDPEVDTAVTSDTGPVLGASAAFDNQKVDLSSILMEGIEQDPAPGNAAQPVGGPDSSAAAADAFVALPLTAELAPASASTYVPAPAAPATVPLFAPASAAADVPPATSAMTPNDAASLLPTPEPSVTLTLKVPLKNGVTAPLVLRLKAF